MSQNEKPNISEKVRDLLTRKGALKGERIQAAETPKVDNLVAWARKRGYGVTVTLPVPDPEAEPEDQAARVVVTDADGETWEWWDAHPAAAVANALAEALEATELRQVDFLAAAAD